MNAPQDKKVREGRVLFVLTMVAFLLGLDLQVVSPLLPPIAQTAHFNVNLGGLLVTAYALFYGLLAPFFGPISDRWGRKRMMILGMIIFSIGTGLTAFGTSLPALLVIRAIAGLGGAMAMPSVYASIGDLFSYERRGKAMGMVVGAMGGATVIGIPIGILLGKITNWGGTFLFIAVLGLITTVLMAIELPLLKSSAAQQQKRSAVAAYFGHFKNAFSNSSILFALLATFLWWLAFQSLFANLGIFYHDFSTFSLTVTGFIFAGAGLCNMIGNNIGGRLADRIGKKTIVMISCVLSAIAEIILPLLHATPVAAACMQLFWALCFGFGQGSLSAMVSELDPKSRATVMSLSSSATYLGMTLGTTLATVFLNFNSFIGIGIMSAVSLMLVLAIFFSLVKERAAKPNESSNANAS